MVWAHNERERQQDLRTAWLAATVAPLVWAKRAYTPTELLGWNEPTVAVVPLTPDQRAAEVSAFWRQKLGLSERGH